MGLEPDDAVDDVRSGFLQAVREFDVLRFVRARHQLDNDRDFLARRRRVDELADDRGLRSGPVERLLDREDVRVRGRLGNEIDDRRERVKRVMQQHVLDRDRIENRLVGEQLLRHRLNERRIQQV